MKKYLIAGGLVLALVLAAPAPAAAQSLNVAQLRAIIASLQAQLNVLIAKLQLQIQQQNNPTTSSNQLTADKILNSNGFVNGKKQIGQYSSSDLSGIIFGQLDNDSEQEAIAIQTNCGASCGKEIVAFKLVNNTVLMVSLPDSAVSGAAQNIDVMNIGPDGLITITGTDNFGSKTNYYRVSLVNGVLKAEKISSNSSQSSISSPTSSLKASLNVTALNGAVQCFKAPCEFPLSGAQVTVYNANNLLVGSKIVGSDGLANFVNLNPGTYTVYVSASGYTKTSGQTVGLVSGQTGTVKIPVFLSH